MFKLVGTVKIHPLKVWDPAARVCHGCAGVCRAVPHKRWILTILGHKIFLTAESVRNRKYGLFAIDIDVQIFF